MLSTTCGGSIVLTQDVLSILGAAATGEKVVVAGGYFGSTNLDTAEVCRN